MPQLLYSATDPQRKPKAGLVDAASAEEALARLHAAGLTDIELHDEPNVAAQRTDRIGLSERESARLAEFELRVRRVPGLATVLTEVARANCIWIAIIAALTIWSWMAHYIVRFWIGVLLLGFMFGLPIWRFRHADRYNRLLRAFATGDWSRAEALLRSLRSASGPDDPLQFDLDIREAMINARRGNVAQSVAQVEKWRPRLAVASPGLFEGRIASVYAAAGDYERFVEQMRKACEAMPNDPSRQLDLALAEARFGDVDVADRLLENLHAAALPVHGRPFIHWTRGLIALRRGEKSAEEQLGEGVAGFLEYASNPVMWSTLALCSGAYALALARAGKPDEARCILGRVSSTLMIHGDQPLLKMIQVEVGPGVAAGA